MSNNLRCECGREECPTCAVPEGENPVFDSVCDFLADLILPDGTAFGDNGEPLIGLWARSSAADAEVQLFDPPGLIRFVAARLGENELTRKAVTVAAGQWAEAQKRIVTS